MFEIVPRRGMLLHVPRCSNVVLLGSSFISIDLRFRLFSLRPFAWEEARREVSKVVETYLILFWLMLAFTGLCPAALRIS